MTDEQRNIIIKLRQQGLGYKRIAKALGVSRDTVRGYCRNHGLNNCAPIHLGNCQHGDKKRIIQSPKNVVIMWFLGLSWVGKINGIRKYNPVFLCILGIFCSVEQFATYVFCGD